MAIGEFQNPHPSPGDGPSPRRRGGGKDWSQPSGSGSRAPTPFDSYDPALMETRPPPPVSFVRSLSKFLGAEMLPVQEKRDLPWPWDIHPGSGVLTLPFPRCWTFKRKGARAAVHLPSFKDHVVVGSWKIPSGSLSWWIAAAQATASAGLERERAFCRLQREDPALIPRGFRIVVLPPKWNWMEPVGPDVHLLLAGSPTEFPALDPEAAAAYARSAAMRGL
jgi:hypothetical protein